MLLFSDLKALQKAIVHYDYKIHKIIWRNFYASQIKIVVKCLLKVSENG